MGKRTNTAVWSDKKNRWQINVQKDGQRRSFYSAVTGRTGQREANAKADEWLDKNLTAGARIDVLWARYLERTRATTGTSNVNKVVSLGENYILPFIGHLKAQSVTEAQLQSILDRAYRHGSFKKERKQRRPRAENETLSRKTLLNIAGGIKAFLRYCRLMEHATTLLPENLTVPNGARYKGKTILQPDNLAVLFDIDTTILRGKRVFDEYIYAYRFQVACGLRPGELVGLEVGDVSKSNEVHIRRAINTSGEITQGKNSNAIRSFIMCAQAKEAYDAQMLFLRDLGVPIQWNTPLFQINNQHTYYGRWSTYLKSNKLPHISPYELRHTFVSIAKCLPDGQVRSLVGHSRSMDTFGQYGHVVAGESEQTAEDVSGLFTKLIANGAARK